MSVHKHLDSLNNMQTYTLALFALYNFRQDSGYLVSSELACILDKDNFIKIVQHFGGTTIKIPTIDDINLMVKALLLYEMVDIEGNDFEQTVNTISKDSNISVYNLTKVYDSLCDTMSCYNFGS
jgi:hypothetical protein